MDVLVEMSADVVNSPACNCHALRDSVSAAWDTLLQYQLQRLPESDHQNDDGAIGTARGLPVFERWPTLWEVEGPRPPSCCRDTHLLRLSLIHQTIKAYSGHHCSSRATAQRLSSFVKEVGFCRLLEVSACAPDSLTAYTARAILSTLSLTGQSWAQAAANECRQSLLSLCLRGEFGSGGCTGDTMRRAGRTLSTVVLSILKAARRAHLQHCDWRPSSEDVEEILTDLTAFWPVVFRTMAAVSAKDKDYLTLTSYLEMLVAIAKHNRDYPGGCVTDILTTVVDHRSCFQMLFTTGPAQVQKLALGLCDQILSQAFPGGAKLAVYIVGFLVQTSPQLIRSPWSTGRGGTEQRVVRRKAILCLMAAALQLINLSPTASLSPIVWAIDDTMGQPVWTLGESGTEEVDVMSLLVEADNDIVRFLSRQLMLMPCHHESVYSDIRRRLCLNCHRLFAALLHRLGHDHLVLVDWLTSPETGFLEYFIRYLKLAVAQSSGVDENRNTEGMQHSLPEMSLAQTTGTLGRLYLTIDRLHARGIFPYNATPLLRRLQAMNTCLKMHLIASVG